MLAQPTLNNWFDKAAFTLPANYTYGNSGSDILREDWFKDLDFSLFKTFQIRESAKLEFRAEAFNLTNTPQYGKANTTVGNPNFGIITGSAPGATPRNIQLGFRVLF